MRDGAKMKYEGSIEVDFNGSRRTITKWREMDPDTRPRRSTAMTATTLARRTVRRRLAPRLRAGTLETLTSSLRQATPRG